MAPTPPTIVSLKQDFLTTQTRLLSQPLTPTRAWRNNNKSQEDNSLPEKAVDDALFKLNHRLQQHSRRVYAPQATRHVAEQIDQLYWNAAEAATSHAREGDGNDSDDGEGAAEGLAQGADLADPAVIATLPPEWDIPSEAASHPLEAKRYAELAAELHALAERRRQAAARVARLQRMRALLEPFDSSSSSAAAAAAAAAVAADGESGGGDGVQENLVTRNGEVEAELQRMRMLLARVGGRVSMLKGQDQAARGRGRRSSADSSTGSLFSERGGPMEVDDVEMDERRKVGQLLENF
ncbi:hypothetical protein MFIFM68171_04180 [Madurella fahalii]|uniref:Kinetochore protein fta4 n=1 Tax=Madurella fahalii TaxID=1157608 RepID=A0ABQ0G874_9PEZI